MNIVKNLSNSFNPYPKFLQKKKDAETKKKDKKHKQTKATEIPQKVKEKVWRRDKQKCICCLKKVQMTCANAHYIKRSQGGLGIEENIVTLCPKCHYEEDFGLETKRYENYIESYLKGIYGASWNKEKLIYKK